MSDETRDIVWALVLCAGLMAGVTLLVFGVEWLEGFDAR